MNSATLIGETIRTLRGQIGLTQQQLATKAGLTYQYLSTIENGQENPTLAILEALSGALGMSLPALFTLALNPTASAVPIPTVNRALLNRGVQLPANLTADHVADAMDETHRVIRLMNSALVEAGSRPLSAYIQANNFSGIVSNILTDAFDKLTPYKHNRGDRYPDLIHTNGGGTTGLEIKTTIKIGKGGESHNGHSGWHLIACFRLDKESGDILFLHAMFADLIGHLHPDSDWKYTGSKVNEVTGSQRTETYSTNAAGMAKLRAGSVYLDPEHIVTKRWRGVSLPSLETLL